MRLPILMTLTNTKLLLLALATVLFISCESDKETLEVETPESYIIPLQPGKYITYRVDSTVFAEAGRKEEIHSYQEKHVVDAQFTDNLGRTSYRIYRYMRDVNGTESWTPSGTFVITPLKNTVEVIQNNMRVIALSGPIREGQSWRGNRFLPTEPYSYIPYSFSNDDDMGTWDFVIESIGQTETINNQEIPDVLTVSHVEEFTNLPIVTDTVFASKSLSLDKYAKNIGLVYQEHTLWEYQPKNSSNTTAYYIGFGVKRTMLEHN